jgi:glycosyltransferase 2 family protein
MRRVVVIIILLLAISLVIFGFSELKNVVETLQKAHPWFLGLALLVQTLWFFVLGWIFQSIYAALGLWESKRRLTLVAAASAFVSIVTPSAGLGGLALFITDGRARGLPSGKVTLAGALYILLDQAAFLCVLAVAMVVLIRRNNLGAGEITASLILLSIACVLAFLLFLGYRSAEALGDALARIVRVVNRIVRPLIHREYLSEARAHAFAHEIAEGLSSLPERPRSLILPLVLSLANKVLLMGVLICSFLSFDVPFSAGTIIGGFAIAYLFLIVSPTPSGIGVVEGIMALALSSLRVEFSQAVIITLAYRGITFWLPLAIGALAFRALHANRTKAPEVHA